MCVSDLDRSTRFYVDVLGFEELFTMDMGDEVAATMEQDDRSAPVADADRDDVRIELLQESRQASGDGERRPMDRLGLTHLASVWTTWRTWSTQRWPPAEPCTATPMPCSRAQGGGGPVGLMYLTDPDGTSVELMSGTPDLSGLRGD